MIRAADCRKVRPTALTQVSVRDIPAVDKVLCLEDVRLIRKNLGQEQTVAVIREAIDDLRRKILGGEIKEVEFDIHGWIGNRVDQIYQQQCSRKLRTVINATGVVLHTNLGRAPLAEKAIAAMQEAAGYTNVEIDLDSGTRSLRGGHTIDVLCRLTGAEDAVVVNNCAAATVLVLQALADGREVVISRGQLVEIGGGFRLPEVFGTAGVFLKEVGTTNRSYIRDYEQAVNELTGAILRVHRSNFHLSGFVAEPTIGELANHDAFSHLPVIDDLGSGLVTDLTGLQIHEPTVQASIDSGADVCLFSGDKLFGGPQCGIIVGKSKWLEPIKKHPMMRALRCDKTTLAGVGATAEIHLAKRAFTDIPIYRSISLSEIELRDRCASFVSMLPPSVGSKTKIVETTSRIGGGSLPHIELKSYGIGINDNSSEQLAQALRNGTPSVVGRQSDGVLLLDLRTVAIDQLGLLARSLERAMS